MSLNTGEDITTDSEAQDIRDTARQQFIDSSSDTVDFSNFGDRSSLVSGGELLVKGTGKNTSLKPLKGKAKTTGKTSKYDTSEKLNPNRVFRKTGRFKKPEKKKEEKKRPKKPKGYKL
tara:strand:+ start:3161 stop:3514 length:354 start_codon:yes stop_codon:yes gene_type:complete